MLTSIYRALFHHLKQLGQPVYFADCVPEGTVFPYITAKIAAPLNSRANGSVTLTFWFLDDQPYKQRLAQADQLLQLLPTRGLRLETEQGAILLRPEGSALCVRESAAQGVRTVWKLQCFPAL